MSGKNKKKIAVLNWAGHGNLGDELFNEAYRALFPGWDISFFTNDAGKALPQVDFDVINKCDLFALGGGELIQRGQLFLPPYWTNKIKVEIPKIILGCGVNVNKYSELRPEVIRELENFAYIGLRDHASIELLQNHPTLRSKAKLFYDLVFSADFSNIKSFEPKERVLVVIPTDRINNKYDNGVIKCNIVKNLVEKIKAISWAYPKIVFLSFGREDNDDYKTCLELAKNFSGSEVIYGNQQLILEAIAGASIVYSCRLHGLILSKIFEKPCSIYLYHRKLGRVSDILLGCEAKAIRGWQRSCLDQVLEDLQLCS